MAFANQIGQEVRTRLLEPEFFARKSGRVFWAKKATDTDYQSFAKEHPCYEDRTDAVYTTIQGAIDACQAGRNDIVLVTVTTMAAGATDPTSWAENLTIAATKSGMSLIGLSENRTQGGLPQIKKGSGSTAQITIRACGVKVANLGVNGASATGGGILLDDDGSTKSAIGTTIENCHFKNCVGSAAAATGGAIMWAATGGAWQVRITGCHFYNNRAGIVLIGTSSTRPQDVVIDNCTFMSSANTTIDCDIYLAGGSGVDGLVINNCVFATVDVPAYATSPTAARYLDLTGCTDGILSNCMFACTGKTFGAAGNAAKIPTTIRIAACYQEGAIITRT